MATVEIQTPSLSGSMDADFVDLAGNGQANIVRSTEAMRIDVSWTLSGSLAPSIAGTWYVQAQFQSADDVQGEFFRPTTPISVSLDGRSTPYTAQISLPPGSFDLNNRDSQVYDVDVTLNYHDTNGAPGPMAGFVSLGKLQVYR